MIPPGWNVTEPIGLAAGLYKVIESLKSAPEDAKAFTAKIERFRRSLTELHRVLDDSLAFDPSRDQAYLREALADCQSCVRRCQNFHDSFQKLSQDGAAKFANAAQAARWVWRDRKIVKLRDEIDSQMSNIGLTLLIKSLCVISVFPV